MVSGFSAAFKTCIAMVFMASGRTPNKAKPLMIKNNRPMSIAAAIIASIYSPDILTPLNLANRMMAAIRNGVAQTASKLIFK